MSFLPAVGDDATKAIGREIRSWRLNRRSDLALKDLARMINPIVRGWINYYGRFYKSLLYPLLRRLNEHLARWAVAEIQTAAPPPCQSGALVGGASRDATRPSSPTGGWGCDPDGWMMGAG